MSSIDTTEAPAKPRKTRTRKGGTVLTSSDFPESQTDTETTPQDSPSSPEMGQGAIAKGLNVESIHTTTTDGTTGTLGAFPRIASEPKTEKEQADAARLKAIEAAEEECERLESLVDEAKEVLKGRKADLEAAIIRGRGLAKKRRDLPLFDNRPAPQETTSTDDPDDAWRFWKLSHIADLPLGSLEAFDAAGLVTMGDLVRWQEKGNTLEDLPGIGERKAEQISDALAAVHASKPWATSATADEDADAMHRQAFDAADPSPDDDDDDDQDDE